jgi:hypothetical protein
MKKERRTRWGLEKGNIDLGDRPVVKNPDGSISTVRSASKRIGGKEVLFPTVAAPDEGTFGTAKSKNPRIISSREAAEIYKKTGQHLGKFRTGEQADQYARALHKMQEKQYVKKGRKKII